MAVQWDVIEDGSNQDVENVFFFFKPVDRASIQCAWKRNGH